MTAAAFGAPAEFPEPLDDPSYPVRVEIFEDLEEETWLAPPEERAPATRYSEPGFAFVRIPTRFSRNALALDRSTPFSLRATAKMAPRAGWYTFRLRSKGLAEFSIDGKPLLQTAAQKPNRSSNDTLPPPILRGEDSLIRPAEYPHQDVKVSVELDGGEHEFALVAVIGGKGLVPDPGELSVSYAAPGEVDRVLGGSDAPLLVDGDWEAFAAESIRRHDTADIARRRAIDREVKAAWNERHRRVREWLANQPAPQIPELSAGMPVSNAIDRFIGARLEQEGLRPTGLTSDLEFLRRISLDATGLIPTVEQIREYLADAPEQRRKNAIERFLAEPGWADHWVSYWQDVLAENPGILKPDLNNTGPFRWYLHQAFSDGTPFDRLVTELIEMEGSLYKGAPQAFAMASLNDSPMAAKADILSQAFLGGKLSCARCHDAPFHPYKQKDTFGLAAMLEGRPLMLPESSTVPLVEGGRKPYVEITLKPGDEIEPHWPFGDLITAATIYAAPPRNTEVLSRHQLAALIVSPSNERFAQVTVNRIWKRYMGLGIVEPADDWANPEPSHPELLAYLSREILESGYDLKHLARLIFSSHAYQRKPVSSGAEATSPEAKLFAGPLRRPMTAEQLIDSLHLAAGKSLDSEDLNLNPLGDRPLSQFLNMGKPSRAWEMTALSNERDRPSLALPRAQALVDMLTTFGWRQSRMNPATVRDDGASAMQTLVLANGATGTRATRLSDDSVFTRLSLDDLPLEELVGETFLRLLSRPPSAKELAMFTELLEPVYENRIVQGFEEGAAKGKKTDTRISWANHMDGEATLIRMEEERRVRMGDEPAKRLDQEYRERFEDAVWALVNSPEFVLIP